MQGRWERLCLFTVACSSPPGAWLRVYPEAGTPAQFLWEVDKARWFGKLRCGHEARAGLAFLQLLRESPCGCDQACQSLLPSFL